MSYIPNICFTSKIIDVVVAFAGNFGAPPPPNSFRVVAPPTPSLAESLIQESEPHPNLTSAGLALVHVKKINDTLKKRMSFDSKP